MGRRQHRGSYWTQQRCPACGENFAVMETPEGLLDRFCRECRESFGLTTEHDAEELIAMFGLHHNTPEPKNVTPVKPKVDPEKVAEGIRTQVDYKCAPVKEYTKPITYVCAKNGLHEVRHSTLATIIVRPKEVLGLTQELQEGVTLNLPKLPFLFLQQTISFFRGVEGRMKGSSEALVQIWWDRDEKVHIMHVPEQTVSGGGVRHTSRFDHENEGRYFHVADIHSHGTNMSAFWSGTDNNDERSVTTERLFGVIGKVTRPIPEWKWRMRTRDGFIELNVADIFDMPTADVTFKVTPEVLFRTIGNDATFKDGKAQLWCPVDPFADVEIPASWYEQVKGHAHSSGGSSMGCGSFAGRMGSMIKGYLYIDGNEYTVDGPVIRPTGRKLVTKAELEQNKPII